MHVCRLYLVEQKKLQEAEKNKRKAEEDARRSLSLAHWCKQL